MGTAKIGIFFHNPKLFRKNLHKNRKEPRSVLSEAPSSSFYL